VARQIENTGGLFQRRKGQKGIKRDRIGANKTEKISEKEGQKRNTSDKIKGKKRKKNTKKKKRKKEEKEGKEKRGQGRCKEAGALSSRCRSPEKISEIGKYRKEQ